MWGRRKRPYDEQTVHQVADLPVEGRPHTPSYLDERESFAQLTAYRSMTTVRLQILVAGEIERLDETWRHTRERTADALREQAVLFVANSLAISLRDVAGQPESPVHTRATDLAGKAAAAVGEARLTELSPPLGKNALREFFFPQAGTRQFERVGDEMVEAAVSAYIDELRRGLSEEPSRTQEGTDSPEVHN